METSQEYIESRIEIEAENELHHIIENKSELFDFFMGNLTSLEQLCAILVAHRKNRAMAGRIAWQQIENDVWKEVKQNVRNRYE